MSLGNWDNSDNVSHELKGVDGSQTTGLFCSDASNSPNRDFSLNSTLPGVGDQVQWISNPYPSSTCQFYTNLKKPGINPLTLRGKTDNVVTGNVDDIHGMCIESGGLINSETGKEFGSNCLNSLFFCNSTDCLNDAPGGLADWQGKPRNWDRNGNMQDSYFKQIYANSPKSMYYQGGVPGYEDPIGIQTPELMKNGFVMEDCECNDDTWVLGFIHEATKGTDLGGPINPNKVRRGTGIYTDDAARISAGMAGEVWNGGDDSDCVSWRGDVPASTLIDYEGKPGLFNTCSYTLEKYAKTCNWCKGADITIVANAVPIEENGKAAVPTEGLFGDWTCEDRGFDGDGQTPSYGGDIVGCISNKPIVQGVEGAVHGELPGNWCGCDSEGFDRGDCFGLSSDGTPRLGCAGCKNPKTGIKAEGLTPNTCPLVSRGGYRPGQQGDCKICDEDFWKWVPGGPEAVADESHPLHFLAKMSYQTKKQYVDRTDQVHADPTDFNNVITGDFANYCSMTDSTVNNCAKVCDSEAVVDWGASSDTVGRYTSPFIFGQPVLPSELGDSPGNIKTHSCPTGHMVGKTTIGSRMICERNPVLSLVGNTTEENEELATNWVNGLWNMDKYSFLESQGGKIGTQSDGATDEQLKMRAVKAMRCCLGQQPGFKYTRPDGTIKEGPENDFRDGVERWEMSDCPPGFTCPSSGACKQLFADLIEGNHSAKIDINDFGAPSYPINWTLDPNASSSASEEDMTNLAYYAKAYCQLMSGGKKPDDDKTFGIDDEVNTLCRKAMYKYCTEPIEVEVNEDQKGEYALDKYTLPLNMFGESCNRWFRGDLSEALPSDYGTRDMALGWACQKMQQDGWVDPTTTGNNHKFISAFTNDNKVTDTSGHVIDLQWNNSGYRNIGELVDGTCGCFWTGAQCGSGNCSYFYCGAGTDSGGNTVSLTESFGNVFDQTVDLNPYSSDWQTGTDMSAPAWTSGMDNSNFTCVSKSLTNPGESKNDEDDSEGVSSCFNKCNYVNTYDVCWNASPNERKFETQGQLWDCDPIDSDKMDACKPYNPNKYSCFGPCPIDENGIPNCGTDEWFNQTNNITPNEKDPGFKNTNINPLTGEQRVLEGAQYTKWQNSYMGLGDTVKATIPGWGVSIETDGSPRSACMGKAYPSITPYGIGQMPTKSCQVNQATTVNNNGVLVGGVSIVQDGTCQIRCEGEGDCFQQFMTSGSNDFIDFMGSNVCNDENCRKNSKVCVSEEGDNCMVCGLDNQALVDSPDKPVTCCTSPNLMPIDDDGTWESKNTDIINSVGNNVSYICWNEQICPVGTNNLDDLQDSCNPGCSERTEVDCNDCPYCGWNGSACQPSCPLAPQAGWGIATPITLPPTLAPTEPPASTEPPSSGSVGGIALSKRDQEILGGVLGSIAGLVILGVIIYYARQAVKRRRGRARMQ